MNHIAQHQPHCPQLIAESDYTKTPDHDLHTAAAGESTRESAVEKRVQNRGQ